MFKAAFSFLIAVLYISLSSNASALEFSSRSLRQINGASSEYGIAFTSRQLTEDRTSIELELNGKRIVVEITDDENITLNGYKGKSEEAALLSAGEAANLKKLLSEIARKVPGRSKAGNYLIRSLNLLSSWPPNLPLKYSSADTVQGISPELIPGSEWTSACEWPPFTGFSEDLCTEMNKYHEGDYISSGNPTGLRVRGVDIYYPLQCTIDHEFVGPYPYDQGDCYGRCGRGCIGDGQPNNNLNIFTQNCFNHDTCVTELSLVHPYCNQMFLYSARDFLFGADCEIYGTAFKKTFDATDYDYGYSVQQTKDGGYIITGSQQIDMYHREDVYLSKLNADGDLLWEKTFDRDNDYDCGYSVQQTSDGGYIISGDTVEMLSMFDYASRSYLIKTDSDGNLIWEKTFKGEVAYSVKQTRDGGYIFTGWDSYSGRSYDLQLVKTDADGNMTWEKTFGGSEADYGHSVQQTKDGGYIIAGSTMSYGAGKYDFYLVKTDVEGDLIWEKTFGGLDTESGSSVQQTKDGGYIIAGSTMSYGAGKYDIYLVKTDAGGNMAWEKTFGGLDYNLGYSVQQTTDEGYIITGYTTSYATGDKDVYLIKTDENGDMTWQRAFNFSPFDIGRSVKQTTDGGYIIVGESGYYSGEDRLLIKTNPVGIVTSTPYSTDEHGDAYQIRIDPDGARD